MKAVVLAAGEGARLRPLTDTRPKHLISISGKPLLEYVLLASKQAGINEALIVVHYMADRIKQYFGDGSKIGMKLEYVVQPKVGGTADATMLAEPYITEDFLTIYGDLLVTANPIQLILRSHKKENPSVSMAVVTAKHPENYGVVKLKDNNITDIVEKPLPGDMSSNLVNAGVYIFSREIFKKIKQTKSSQRGERELTTSLRLLIGDNQPVCGIKIPEEDWLDVGRPWDLLEANRRVLNQIKPTVKGQIEEGAHLIGPIFVSEGTRIRSGAYIEGPVFIDNDSDIGPNCYIRPYTSLGKRVKVGNACEIKNSILMDESKVGHLSYVGDSIIGEKSNLGAGTITANYRLNHKSINMNIKGEVIDSEREKLGTIMGDHVKTGINVSFMPGIKIGSHSWIGPNIVVYHDISPKAFLLVKQKIESKKQEE